MNGVVFVQVTLISDVALTAAVSTPTRAPKFIAAAEIVQSATSPMVTSNVAVAVPLLYTAALACIHTAIEPAATSRRLKFLLIKIVSPK